MRTFAIVPVKRFNRSKTRLAGFLSEQDRIDLASVMLVATLKVLVQSSKLEKVVVVSNDPGVQKYLLNSRMHFIHEESEAGVNSAVSIANRYCVDNGAEATLVIPIDLPLLSVASVDNLISLGEQIRTGIVLCPSQRYDGTNALLRKPPCVIDTHYDKNSYASHVEIAKTGLLELITREWPEFTNDVDNIEDVKDLLAKPSSNPVADFLRKRVRLVQE